MAATDTPFGRQTPSGTEPKEEFARQVRDAIAHLYDTAHLQNHPLCVLLDKTSSSGAINSAQALRRVLLETIELLRPNAQLPYNAKEWRPYRVMFQHYVQRMPSLSVAQELAISDRQYQREHARALRAVIDLLWNRLQGERTENEPSPHSAEDSVTEELERLVAGAQREPLDIEELVESAVGAMESLAKSRGIALEVHFLSKGTIYGDRALLRQILLNILSYLVMHTEGAHLALTVGGSEEGHRDELRLCFNLLTASGEAPMSTPLLKAEESPRLSLGCRLAERVGGRLWIEDSLIHLLLPSRRDVLLVVDDNQDVIDMFRRFLTPGRFKVLGARSVEQALSLAKEARPYLIMLDVMMPGHDGWEALQSLKHNPVTGDIPVIICSILNERELAFSLGADDYIQKPVTQRDLLDMLARWADRR
ncbi:MAG: response regulator [Chloroflexi bacterium]|nr:response regulator [Chloroflexota bacterium]